MLAGQTTGGKTAGRGRPKTDDSSRPTLDESYPHCADDDVAQAIGLKRTTYRKTKKVFDTANDEKAPEPIRAVAQQQMAALDTGETTAHAARQLAQGRRNRHRWHSTTPPACGGVCGGGGGGKASPDYSLDQLLSALALPPA